MLLVALMLPAVVALAVVVSGLQLLGPESRALKISKAP